MQWLITGATGFVGTHLVQHLEDTIPNVRVVGTTLHPVPDREHTRFVECNLLQQDAVERLVETVQPTHVVHLAGQANVQSAYEDPWPTFEANVRPLTYLLQACRKLPTPPRVLVVTSAEVYGRVLPDQMPITEQTTLTPTNPYSVSKAAQDLLAQQYFLSFGLPIVRARPFNHIGPGQSEAFVATGFAMQIARIEAGLKPPVIHVGNLQSQRDFTDVRDVVRAYRLLAEMGSAGEAYNVASGRSITIGHLLEMLLSLSHISVEISVDTQRLRPIDLPVLNASCDKLRQALQWQPTYPLAVTLRDILEDCRRRVRTHEMEN